ncbi:MAG: ABC transporter permease subunit [Oscillospiraceae bacterium]
MKKIQKVLFPLVFWVLVWGIAAGLVDKALLLPGPLLVLRRLAELGVTADFWLAALATILRIFFGMGIGVALGALLAGATHFVPLCDWLLTPLIQVLRATPVASFILLVLLWVTRSLVPGIISALMVLPVVWGSVKLGLERTDSQLLELCRDYRFSRGKTLRLLYLPSVLPHFRSGVQTALGLAWKAGVAAEVIAQPPLAIGTQVYFSKVYLETPDLFAWTLVVILLSFLVEYGVKQLLRERGDKG